MLGQSSTYTMQMQIYWTNSPGSIKKQLVLKSRILLARHDPKYHQRTLKLLFLPQSLQTKLHTIAWGNQPTALKIEI